MINQPDPNVWEHCSANAEGMGFDPVEAPNLVLGLFAICYHILFSTQPKIFFFFFQEVTKYMFLMIRKRFQHSSEYFGCGLKIVKRFAIVADSCFSSY